MGGAIIAIEANTEQEAQKLLDAHKREAERLGLKDERDRIVGYDDKKKVWRGYIWLRS